MAKDVFGDGEMEYLTAYTRSLTNGGSTGDRYVGTQTLQGWYGMLDLKVLEKLRLTERPSL